MVVAGMKKDLSHHWDNVLSLVCAAMIDDFITNYKFDLGEFLA